MRRDLIIAAKKAFEMRYPMGFDDPELTAIRKKHRISQMHEMAESCFEPKAFEDVDTITDNINKIFSRASLVSVFEKMRYRDFNETLIPPEKTELTEGLRMMLHGDHESGFAIFMHVLEKDKLAKWPLMTVIPYYYAPNQEAFLKPTTVKRIIKVFELNGLVYSPKPSYQFYVKYKEALKEMREIAGPSVARDYGAFSGFLMMTMDMIAEPDNGLFKGAPHEGN